MLIFQPVSINRTVKQGNNLHDAAYHVAGKLVVGSCTTQRFVVCCCGVCVVFFFPPVGDDVTFNSWISRVRTRLLDGVQEIRLLLALDLPILLLASRGTLPFLGIVLEHTVVVLLLWR